LTALPPRFIRPFFIHGPGPGLEPVDGEFQPSFATAHAGGGAHFITLLHSIFVLNYTLMR
jgi:hypothetical protein